MPTLAERGNTYGRSDIAQCDGYKVFNPRDSSGYEATCLLVNSAIRNGFIDPSAIRRVLDFGAGSGEPTLALRELLQPGTVIEAAEVNPYKASMLISSGIVPEEGVYRDGLTRLKEVKADPSKRYDLVTAFMLPPYDVFSFSVLYRASSGALSPDGQLVVYSDPETFSYALGFCKQYSIDYNYNPWGIIGPIGTHNTLHIPASSFKNIA